MFALLGLGYLLFFTASVAFSQSPMPSAEPVAAVVSQPNFFQHILQMMMSPQGLAKLVAFAIALQILLRGAAEALTRISNFTDNTWDNKAAAWLSQAAWVIGSVLGKFGYGTPKLVVEEMKAPEVKQA